MFLCAPFGPWSIIISRIVWVQRGLRSCLGQGTQQPQKSTEEVGELVITFLADWWLTYPSETYESQWVSDYPIYCGKSKLVETTNQLWLYFWHSHRLIPHQHHQNPMVHGSSPFSTCNRCGQWWLPWESSKSHGLSIIHYILGSKTTIHAHPSSPHLLPCE